MLNLAQERQPAQALVLPFPKTGRQTMTGIEEGYTRLPNLLIDSEIMADLSDKAFKCLMFILRQTLGFGRNSHTISITQFQKYCGIKKEETVTKAIRELETCKAIQVERKTGCLNEYSLTLNHYHQTVLPPSNGTTPNKGGESTPIKGGESTPIKGGSIKENFKDNIKENFKETNPPKNSVDDVLNLWTPDLHSLNSWLQRSGETPMTQDLVNQILLEVNAHYEPRLKAGLISDTQMYSNFTKWIKRKFIQKQNTPSGKQNPNLDVNTVWANQPAQQYAPVNSPVDIPEDFV